jgi:DNA invertase Pin-like site-specific DNA recombinase
VQIFDGRAVLCRRILETEIRGAHRARAHHPQNGRLRDSQGANMGHVLGYARVSTDDQDLEGQRQRLKKAGAIRIFEDIMSGRRFERPGLAQLLDYARTGDCLCVVRLDRLGRSLRELLEVVDLLRERGIHFQSLEEKIDTSSAAGELIFHMFGAIAHFERRLIGERTKDGLAAAKAKGRRPGRPPVDAHKLDAAFKLIEAGLSPTDAARQVGLGRATVYKQKTQRARAGTAATHADS